MGTYDSFATSSDMEKEGIWIDYGDAGKFRIARAGGSNKAFVRQFQRMTKPHRRAIQADAMNDEAQLAIMRQVFIDTVLLGWENVTDRDGKEMPFSKENAAQLFTDLPDLFGDLLSQAQNYSLFRDVILETDAGN